MFSNGQSKHDKKSINLGMSISYIPFDTRFMNNREFIIREAFPADEPFLREMLYNSLYVPLDAKPFDRDIIKQPEILKYVESWGRSGDIGLIAIDSSLDEAVGAAWIRLFSYSDQGYGYFDDITPELGIAVLPAHRGCGSGSALLNRILATAASLYRTVSLSVSCDNPARYLYERFGFEPVIKQDNSLTMLKRLKS